MTDPPKAIKTVRTSGRMQDRRTGGLMFGVFFLIVCILSVVIYGLVGGVFDPPAPRTQPEAVVSQMAAKVKAQPTNGRVWADYAEALYATGDKKGAILAIAQASEVVTGTTILFVNNADLHLLLLEGNNAEVVKRSTAYVQKDIDIRMQEAAENAAKGIAVPYESRDNESTITLFTLRATAEGNLGKWKEAVIDYTNALKLDPQAADILVMRGWARLKQGNKKGAAADFKEALAFLPDDPSATQGLKQATSTESTTSK